MTIEKTKQKLKSTSKTLAYLTFCLFAFHIITYPQQDIAEVKVVDKTVASVSDGVGIELITYSDLVWQLALNPNVNINPPSSDDLNRALQIAIKFRLIALESERLPSAPPTRNEIDKEILRILARFPSTAVFVKRLNQVGFKSTDDENFQNLMQKRVAIEKYIDFRFRSFVVITPEDERKYYDTTFTKEFRRKNPGLLLPKFEAVQGLINKILTEQKVESDIERFLDNAESRAEIIILSEV